ncbi:adenosine receptor A1-like [Salminus brasiliensis]|uniref:adenosine receptor A1-like n=1 Tax=Salminus brasiliensis TaxID=930266 RepID=UPI003B834693
MSKTAVWLFIPLEVFVAVACCLGNALVVWAVWSCGALRKTTFCFIASLAVADFLVGFVTIPLGVLVDVRLKISFYGCLFMCCVLIMVQMASVTLLLAIAVDRFLRVRIPLTYKTTVTEKSSWVVVALCWLVAAFLSFVPMFGWHNSLDSTTHANSTSFECSFFTVVSTSYLVNFLFFSCFLPPLAVMTGLYCYIFMTTRRQLRANIGVPTNSSINYLKERRLATSLALVLVLFAICWFPLFLMHTVKLYYQNDKVPSFNMHIGVLLSHASSAVNPIVYAFRIPKIKAAFKKLWVRLCHCRKEQEQSKESSAQMNTDNAPGEDRHISDS